MLRLDPAAEASAPAAAPATRARLHASLVGGVVVLLLGAAASGAAWWFYGGPTEHPTPVVKSSASAGAPAQSLPPIDVGLAQAPRLSIVVLPFQNLSGDAKDDYLAEGITEDITTDLSRVTGMFVIARELPIHIGVRLSTYGRSARNSGCAMSSRGACANSATRCV